MQPTGASVEVRNRFSSFCAIRIVSLELSGVLRGRLRVAAAFRSGGKRLRNSHSTLQICAPGRIHGNPAMWVRRRWGQAHRAREETGGASAFRDPQLGRAWAAGQLRSGTGSLQLHCKQLSFRVSCDTGRHAGHVISHVEGTLVLSCLRDAGACAGQLLILRANIESSAICRAGAGEFLQLPLNWIIGSDGRRRGRWSGGFLAANQEGGRKQGDHESFVHGLIVEQPARGGRL